MGVLLSAGTPARRKAVARLLSSAQSPQWFPKCYSEAPKSRDPVQKTPIRILPRLIQGQHRMSPSPLWRQQRAEFEHAITYHACALCLLHASHRANLICCHQNSSLRALPPKTCICFTQDFCRLDRGYKSWDMSYYACHIIIYVYTVIVCCIIYVLVWLCIYVYIYLSLSLSLYIYIYIYIYICICICMYVYISIYIYIYRERDIYVYICIYKYMTYQ